MPSSLAPLETTPLQSAVTRVTVILDDVAFRNHIQAELCADSRFVLCQDPGEAYEPNPAAGNVLVYGPEVLPNDPLTPDLEKAEAVLHAAGTACEKIILLSSALAYGASPRNCGLLTESAANVRKPKFGVAVRWLELEALARKSARGQLIVLRLALVLSPTARTFLPRILSNKLAITLPGHDPSIQLLSMEDAARAICCAVKGESAGVFNVAPKGVIPLRAALRLMAIRRLAIPRRLLTILGTRRTAHLDYIRYSWTISNQKISQRLGFSPRQSSEEALAAFLGTKVPASSVQPSNPIPYDDFGMDKGYIAAYQRTLFAFLADKYWRIEVRGTNHIPQHGRALLVGVHRGFMPWDGVMALHIVVKKIGRYPRFLTHPGLFRFPFLFNFMTKLGGIVACRQNAERILERDELLGVFPEGIHGAFTLYRDAYRLQPFRGDSVVKLALRLRAPIVPFVTIGSAEIFPILGKIQSRRWTRYTDWPFFPIIATLPFLPLPSKWHTQFLAPLHLEQEYPPEAHQDPAIVRAITQDIRDRMQRAMEEMLRQRQSIFVGPIFHGEVE
jgi:1-acyl-sn-glycerol-3-phosphate acyltransferase